MKKKILSLLASLLVVVGLMPTEEVKAYNYTVGYGESYFDLGYQLGVNYPDLMAWNGSDGNLYEGQQIWIPDEVLEPGFKAPYSEEYYNSYSAEYYEENYYNDYYDPYYEEPTYYEEASYYEEPSCYEEETCVSNNTYSSYNDSYSSYNDTSSDNTDYASGCSSLSTSYYGNVAYNVGLACEYNDGVVIQPGCSYSAFDVLGDGGYAEGFKASAGLGGDGESITVPGSGICTVETMIWQAMRDAGMTEVERNPHNYGNSNGTCWYAPDPDDQAMFNAGTSNLVVANPYDYPMELHTSYENGEIKVTCTAVH